MRDIDEMAVKVANDDKLFSGFAKQHKHFITNCTFRATKRYITTSDDEWSIALIAFSNAVKSYDLNQGSFLPFAEMIIKNKLIDYYRSDSKHRLELSVNPSVFETNPDEEEYDLGLKIELTEKLIHKDDNSIKYEIEAANLEFKKFGFSFFDLSECYPKSAKTKAACRKAVLFILEHEILKNEIYNTKLLPLKIIQNNTNLPRKLLENHRKYIIAAIEILSGEYPQLAEYLSFIRKGGI